MLFLLLINILFLGGSLQDDGLLLKTNEVSGFMNAVSMASDGKGKIYVLDAVSNEIVKFDETLKEIKRAGKKGWGSGEFDAPTCIEGSSGLELHVSDPLNFRIQKLDLNLSYISSIYTNYESFPENLKYQKPVSTVYVNPFIYSIDGENNRVVTYRLQNQSMYQPAFAFGGFQSAQKPMSKPEKIVKDGLNNIYVYDSGLNTVFKYDNFGNYLNSFESKFIKSISAFNSMLFILTESEILIYDSVKNAYTGKYLFAEPIQQGAISDFMVFSSSKIFVLEKTKIIEYTLK